MTKYCKGFSNLEYFFETDSIIFKPTLVLYR